MEFGLSIDICELLRAEAFVGLKALPRRGVEVGGLLTQRIGVGSTAMVDGFEPIPCEHLYGPSYQLSPLDYENFRARIHAIQARDTVKIGFFFRSSTREVFGVAPEDIAAVGELLSDTAGIVLLRPFLNGNATFRVFQSTNDREWHDFEEFEVRNELIVPAPLMAAVPAQTMDNDVGLVELPPLDSPVRRSVDTPPLHRFALNWVALFCLILVLVVAASVIMARAFWKVVPQTVRSSDPDLGMQVVFRGNNLLLTWNQSLPSVRDSVSGNLQIHDGAQYREIALDSAQVAQAVIYYAPNSDDVTFRLNIQDRKSAQLSGIVRVLANRKGADPAPSSNGPTVVSPPVSEPQNFATGAVQGRPATSKSSLVRKPPQPSKYAERRKHALARTASRAPKQLATQFKPDSRPKAASSPDERDLQRAEAASSGPQAPDINRSSQLRAQSAAEVSVLAPADNSPRIATTTEPDKLGFGAPSIVPVDVPVPARPLKKIIPERHASLAPPILVPTTVTVEVMIDREGRVVEAHALRSPSKYWAGKAVEAAQQWRFEPAMLHGQSIPSVYTIDFRFMPQ